VIEKCLHLLKHYANSLFEKVVIRIGKMLTSIEEGLQRSLVEEHDYK